VRPGGDEFVVLLPELDQDIELASGAAHQVALKIQEILTNGFVVDGFQLHVSCSIGIALFPKENETVDDIFKFADAAMYKSKEQGRNKIRFFSADMKAVEEYKVKLQALLPDALKNGELYLEYQPQVSNTGALVGAEALVRWRQPDIGLVRPDELINIAEGSGFIIQLGDWIVDSVCRHLKVWKERGLPDCFKHIAINISARQFVVDGFSDRMAAIVQQSGIKPHAIEFELTESMLLDNLDVVVAKMEKLRAMGFSLSIDDFGTGYSSLSYLKVLPISRLKIDQSFLRDVENDQSNQSVVEAIIAMARHLGLDVIAEGVETEAQLHFLADKGCLTYQGYLFSKPLSADQLYECWIAPLKSQGMLTKLGVDRVQPKH